MLCRSASPVDAPDETPTSPPSAKYTLSPTSSDDTFPINPTNSPTDEPTPSPQCNSNQAMLNIEVQVDSKGTPDKNRLLLHQKIRAINGKEGFQND